MRASDHRPIRVDFVYEPDDRGNGRFYFDSRLLGKAGIEKIVEKGWNMPEWEGDMNLMERINRCRTELARWKRSLHMNSKNNIERLSKRLEEEIAKLHPNFRTMAHLKSELAEAHR